MPSSIQPGLIILHGNQLEQLREAVFAWLRGHPLGPLETETLLVQSNGIAEWLKVALADDLGVCAATRVALPARFLWEAYRGVLGAHRVPRRSPFDKDQLTWRLMRLLPHLQGHPACAPLARFLAGGDPERRMQLAQRLADLYDQYQVYRADWLVAWEHGRDVLLDARGQARPLAPDQQWQALLWRAVHAGLSEDERGGGRASVHQAFLDACAAGQAPAGRLPRRVVLFGISALPYQTLQAIAALSSHVQVLMAVPNPCQFYWGDIIDGRELLRAERRRFPLRGGRDLSAMPLDALHAHSHPLLASWGRQGRDFVRLLDEFDQGAPQGQRLRLDLFSEGQGGRLLGQVQAAVRDLLPLAEHQFPPLAADDRSLEFHIAHSPQREVEALHDQLLAWLGGDARAVPGLRPRDVVVMVPDIDTFLAPIHAVFGQYRRGDPRHIPFEIGDVRDRSANPLLVALEWLLRLPQQRCRQSEIRDLLDVPSVATRFGIRSDDLPLLARWMEGAGVRWGLDQPHRASLGLGAAGAQNAWRFGLDRMLLGYASGSGDPYQGIEPYPEVGGLDAALAGALAQLVQRLAEWSDLLRQSRTPAEWGACARNLLDAFFRADSETDRLTLGRVTDALQAWLESCELAAYDEAVPLAVVREAWLGQLDEPTLNHQFVTGGVTFCTLMPMRAVPFRVVCLLGMNDGDFPRRAPKADFDLLALPGLARPGDRSRRDDDRYLMLEALLAARDKLYVSWAGRNVRDNSEQPPSVLVSQLRDYLQAGWRLDPAQLTTVHALQPFSRRYFEQGGLSTYAGEWRVMHAPDDTRRSGASGGVEQGGQGAPAGSALAAPDADPALPVYEVDAALRLRLADLADFLRQPARAFCRRRLGVRFDEDGQTGDDDEPFSLDALDQYHLAECLLDQGDSEDDLLPDDGAVTLQLQERARRLVRQGRLPIGALGERSERELVQSVLPARQAWLNAGRAWPHEAPKLAVRIQAGEVELDDWIEHLRSNGMQEAWIGQNASRLLAGKGKAIELRPDKMVGPWLRQLAAAAMGRTLAGIIVGRDALVELDPLEPQPALDCLHTLIGLWRANLDQPLPAVCKTSIALLRGDAADKVFEGGFNLNGEVAEPHVLRLWPDYATLSAHPGFEAASQAVYGPLLEWLRDHVRFTQLGGAE